MDQPFVLLDIRHNVIIGREFLARNRALVNCDLRTLLWKDEILVQYY